MAYFRKHEEALKKLNSLLSNQEDWLILLNADPDAIASALALKKLIGKKVKSVTIARINAITRPDNLAMLRLLRIPLVPWKASMQKKFQRFAILDSQPHHSPLFENIPFDIIIDHHPIAPQSIQDAPLTLLLPGIGACSSIMTELLYSAKVKIRKRLATALQYGIRVDTASFGRGSTEVDLRAYHYLGRFADHEILMQILRSEYLPEWLPYFAQAIGSLDKCANGHFTYIEKIASPDILVVVADFFQKVHGFEWVAIAGEYNDTIVVIFRGNGKIDLGELAASSFGDIGSAGGHKQLARAEVPIKALEKPYLNSIHTRLSTFFK